MATVVGDMQAPINDAVEMAFLGLQGLRFVLDFHALGLGVWCFGVGGLAFRF